MRRHQQRSAAPSAPLLPLERHAHAILGNVCQVPWLDYVESEATFLVNVSVAAAHARSRNASNILPESFLNTCEDRGSATQRWGLLMYAQTSKQCSRFLPARGRETHRRLLYLVHVLIMPQCNGEGGRRLHV